ncbi:hypothetical protein FB451DRAFT_1402175 [Mycena latifolia]|nr:hypothetical protein FB451DRAFT_1402175 [Mycena latifolia]
MNIGWQFKDPDFSLRAPFSAARPRSVNTALAKTDDAVDLIERANILTLRDLKLSLMDVEVSFRFSQPTDKFIFTLGVGAPPVTHAAVHPAPTWAASGPEARAERVLQGRRGHVLGRMPVPKDTRM